MTDAWDDEDRRRSGIARARRRDSRGRARPSTTTRSPTTKPVLAAMPFEEVAPVPELEDRRGRGRAGAAARRGSFHRSTATRASPRRTVSARRWLARRGGRRCRGRDRCGVRSRAARRRVRAPPAGGSNRPRRTAASRRCSPSPARAQGLLRSPTGVAGGRVLLDPGGSGYLTGLPIPAGGTTYWLWLDTASPVRVGSIPDVSTVHFVVHGDVGAVRGVIITTDPGAPAPFSWRALLSN